MSSWICGNEISWPYNIDSENLLYFIFSYVVGYITEESNGKKYLIFVSTDKSKKVLEKYTKLWNETKNQIETVNGGEPIKYKTYFMLIRFESDDDLPLDKILNIPSLIMITRFVFHEENKYYPQVYLHQCLYEL